MITKQLNKTVSCNLLKDKNFDVYCGRGKGSKNDPFSCKIGESGWLGNPVAIGKKCPMCFKTHFKAIDTLRCYNSYLLSRLEDAEFKKAF